MRYEEVVVTPELAKYWLTKNKRNRPLSLSHIDVFAGKIRRGEWKLNGDAIRFNEQGDLIDGQHRLSAIIKTEIPVKTLVIWELEEDVFDTIDGGKPRGAYDLFALRDIPNAANVVAALRLICQYEVGMPVRIPTLSNIQLWDAYQANLGVSDSVSVCIVKNGITTRTVLAACHYLFSRVDSDLADGFIQQLIDGLDVKRGDPVGVLRESIIRLKNREKGRLSNRFMMAIIIKAWNATRKGYQISHLTFRESGPNAEKFPKIR